jgi:hypothetical protein
VVTARSTIRTKRAATGWPAGVHPVKKPGLHAHQLAAQGSLGFIGGKLKKSRGDRVVTM